MSETVDLKLLDVVGSPYCVASEDGEKVYRAIGAELRAGKNVRISLAGVEDLTSAFLNTAIGQLYNGEFSEQFLRQHLSVQDASPEDQFLLKRVVERAKEFFRDPESFEQAVKLALGGEDE